MEHSTSVQLHSGLARGRNQVKRSHNKNLFTPSRSSSSSSSSSTSSTSSSNSSNSSTESSSSGTTSSSSSSNMSKKPRLTESTRQQEFLNFPDPRSVLVNELDSTATRNGFRAIIVPKVSALSVFSQGKSGPGMPSCLGMTAPATPTEFADKVFIQVTDNLEPFCSQKEAKRTLVVDFQDYLELYRFFLQDWTMIFSKMKSNIKHMREGSQAIRLSNFLSFYNHGYTVYTTTLGRRLELCARSDSQDKCLDRVTCWLKLNTSDKQVQQLEIPSCTLAEMFSDKKAFEMLSSLLYKETGQH